jgi:hypothetical protein
MRNTVWLIGMSIAFTAGVLLVSDTGWAQATETPVSGEVDNYVVTEPGELWVDEDGVRHRRNRRSRERYTGDIRGQQFKIVRLNINRETGELDSHGSFTFAGFVGADRVKAKGRFMVLCTGGEPSFCIWRTDARSVWLRPIPCLLVSPASTRGFSSTRRVIGRRSRAIDRERRGASEAGDTHRGLSGSDSAGSAGQQTPPWCVREMLPQRGCELVEKSSYKSHMKVKLHGPSAGKRGEHAAVAL